MGVKGLLAELPSTPVYGLGNVKLLKHGANVADIDTGTLLFACAWHNKSSFNDGNYIPAVRAFQGRAHMLVRVHKWKCTFVFDGRPPPEKQHEHERRRNRPDTIIITSTYILMCIEVCRKQFYPFVVAPEEADSQVCKRSSAIAVGRDSDLLAYDNACVIIVDSYFTGDARVFNMNVPADEETCIKYPLYKYYRQHGVKVLRWFAAVCGCDVSVESVGMKGAGKAAFLLALSMLDSQDTTPLNSSSFACALKEAAATIPACNLEMTVQQIKAELDRVSRWFGDGGSFYDVDCNIRSVSWRIKHQRSEATKQHMQGKTDPKTGHQLTQEQLQTIQSVKSHNLLHNSATPTERVGRTSLPEGKTIETSNNDDLKRFIICRGGNLSVTGGNSMRKDELQKTVASYMSLDEEIPVDTATRFNRTRVNNGVFATIDVNEKRSANQIVDVLVSKGNEFEPHLHKLFLDVQQILHNGQFVEDFDAICLDAPECPEEFIWESFTNVGDSRDQKNIRDSLWKVLQYDEVVYHAFAWGPEKKSIYILSKQVASQKHDDKTGKPEEYFVMAHISVRETTEQSHGHTLGKCHMLMRSYCVKCKAGAGMCYHKGGLLWMQHLHWGEGRQCEKPSTAAWCPWVKGARAKRICSNVVPASNTHIERLPTSNAEAKKKLESGRKRNMHDGVPAKYDVFGGNESKRAALMDPTYTSHERWSGFFGALRNANNGRPCKAEIRYYGATDDGLTDIRCDVALWGTNTEIRRWHELRESPANVKKTDIEISESVLKEDIVSDLRRKHVAKLGSMNVNSN